MDCKRGDVETDRSLRGSTCNVLLTPGHLGHFNLTFWDLVNIRGICDHDMTGEYVSTDMFLIMSGDRSLFTPISCILCISCRA
ncbi:hypothetical protein N7465_009493 [Penicillium sp. CMV-2018d]|nr:hypothetical protein N7465_009493 [Penicillium sp. CMV-2018d]